MPKARKKKKTSFEAVTNKSVFLYGNPNKNKLDILKQMNVGFRKLVNDNIDMLYDHDNITLQLVKNDKKDSLIRILEKRYRKPGINSAFHQNAFDMAITHLSNRLLAIKNDLMSYNRTIFTESKILFAMAIDGKSKDEMTSYMKSINKKNKFHHECIVKLESMNDEEFRFAMIEFQDSYAMCDLEYGIPNLRSVEVPLDSRLMKIERANDIRAPYVIRVTDPFTRGKRIDVPLNTSVHSIHKIRSNKMAGTVKLSVKHDKIRIGWSYERKNKKPATTSAAGVDAGIVDALHCSDGSIYGSLKEAIDLYTNVVEPAFAQRNNLYNKKRKISRYLRHHKDLPVEVRRSLIDKMDRLDKMIKTMYAPFRKKRHYYQILNESISKAVKSFISELDHDNLVVLELLDNKEFNSCKTVNGRFSMFARGQLQNRLIKELNWKGYDFAQIEPAFTSQTCPICGNIDEHNRNGKSFKCTCCGHKDDADHNAAINIKNRFYDEEVSAICDKYYNSSKRQEAIKDLYKRRNEEYCKQHLNESVSV